MISLLHSPTTFLCLESIIGEITGSLGVDLSVTSDQDEMFWVSIMVMAWHSMTWRWWQMLSNLRSIRERLCPCPMLYLLVLMPG